MGSIAGSRSIPIFPEILGHAQRISRFHRDSPSHEGSIYDPDEYAKAMAWTEKYCKVNEGIDFNRPEKQKSRKEKDEDWEFVVKRPSLSAT